MINIFDIFLFISFSDGKPPEKTVLLTFHSVLSDSVFSTAERAIELGCIRSTTQLKKVCSNVQMYLVLIRLVRFFRYLHQ